MSLGYIYVLTSAVGDCALCECKVVAVAYIEVQGSERANRKAQCGYCKCISN